MLDPYAFVFAGPNGSGKTSLVNEVKENGLQTAEGLCPLPELFINPDQVAKDLQGQFPDQNARDEAAASTAGRMRVDAIKSRQTFAFETVMSHPSRINELLLLMEQGYRVLLTFITTDDPAKNVERVTLRYQTGTTTGHFVPPDKVRERYERTLALLPRAAEIADAVFVYDNSVDFEKPRLQAVLEKDVQFSIAPNAKDWVLKRLVKPLQQREQEFNEMLDLMDQAGLPLAETDELRGIYQGVVVLHSQYYLVQLSEATQQAVIHDRLLLDTAQKKPDGIPPSYMKNERLRIGYSLENAPYVERLRRRLSLVKKG